MPIYSYKCKHCGLEYDRIEKVTNVTWNRQKYEGVYCEKCGSYSGIRMVESFKMGSGILETTGKSGYLTDNLTLGKLIDEGGIPAEEKRRLRERDKMITRQNQYTKELNARAKKYNFDPKTDN